MFVTVPYNKRADGAPLKIGIKSCLNILNFCYHEVAKNYHKVTSIF